MWFILFYGLSQRADSATICIQFLFDSTLIWLCLFDVHFVLRYIFFFLVCFTFFFFSVFTSFYFYFLCSNSTWKFECEMRMGKKYREIEIAECDKRMRREKNTTDRNEWNVCWINYGWHHKIKYDESVEKCVQFTILEFSLLLDWISR